MSNLQECTDNSSSIPELEECTDNNSSIPDLEECTDNSISILNFQKCINNPSSVPVFREGKEFLRAVERDDLKFCQHWMEKNPRFRKNFLFLAYALDRSCWWCCYNVCEWLIQKFELNCKNIGEDCIEDCFYFASSKGDVKMAQILFFNIPKIPHLETCLYGAVSNKKLEFIEYSFQRGIFDESHVEILNPDMSLYNHDDDFFFIPKEDYIVLRELCDKIEKKFGQLTKPAKNY
jgi:hypothetical protein